MNLSRKTFKYILFIVSITLFPKAEAMVCADLFRENFVTVYRGINIHPVNYDAFYDKSNLGHGLRKESVWFSENLGTALFHARYDTPYGLVLEYRLPEYIVDRYQVGANSDLTVNRENTAGITMFLNRIMLRLRKDHSYSNPMLADLIGARTNFKGEDWLRGEAWFEAHELRDVFPNFFE